MAYKSHLNHLWWSIVDEVWNYFDKSLVSGRGAERI